MDPLHTEEMELTSERIANALTKEQILKNPDKRRVTPPMDIDH